MEKKQWVALIRKQCEDARTYKPYFDSVIDTLAQILETRDKIHQQFVDEGSQATIIKTTDRSGAENTYKNPLLVLENDFNSQALKYWTELGLTAKSLKSIQNTLKEDDGASFEDILASLGG